MLLGVISHCVQKLSLLLSDIQLIKGQQSCALFSVFFLLSGLVLGQFSTSHSTGKAESSSESMISVLGRELLKVRWKKIFVVS